MNREKIKRLKRIAGLEQKALDRVVLQLKQVNQNISQCEQQQKTIADRHAKAMKSDSVKVSIQQLSSLSTLAAHVNAEIESLATRIETFNQQRTELLDQIGEHRSRIKGWQMLIEKLKRVDAEEALRVAMAEADDRFLRDFAINGSKS